MRAASLLGLFLVAKVCVLAGRSVSISPWAPLAYAWQDLAVVLVFALLDRLLGRPRLAWTVYGLIACYVAINVPVARVLSTPLTWALLRAARGPIFDSITSYLNWINIALLLLIILVAIGLPLVLKLLPRHSLGLAGVLLLPPLIVMGPYASAQIETIGLDRNVLAVLVSTAFPRVGLLDSQHDWRTSPLAEPAGIEKGNTNLDGFRGSAAGRNVVLIALESTAARYLRFHGAADDPMPNLTRLSQQAIVFDNAYATYPESVKGLFSVLCSTYPAMDTETEACERIRTPALAEVLALAGYRTALFHSGRFRYLGMESVVRQRGFHVLEDAGDISGEQQSSFGIDDERLTVKRMTAWMDSLPAGERFYLHYMPIAGHHPYNTPEPGPFPDEQPIDRYRNALHHADVALGELIRNLEARGLARQTLFVIHGDHGEAFGQHEGNFAHTLFIYEENIRVPLLLSAPGLQSQTMHVPAVASLVDIAPTVLDLLGLPAPSTYQGESLLRDRPRMALFFTDYSLGLLGLRDDRWKFIHEIETGRNKLFDLHEDPEELRDLSADQADRASCYRQHLLAWSGSQRKRIKR